MSDRLTAVAAAAVTACALLACKGAPQRGLPTLSPASSPVASATRTSKPPVAPTTTPTPTVAPTATTTPTPTPTPIPPQRMTIRWPTKVSALQPVPIEVEIVPPPGVEATTSLTAVVRHSGEGLIYRAPLVHRGNHSYTADDPLSLPLVSPPGTYRLIILVESTHQVAGDRVVYFQPDVVPLHDLGPGEENGVHEGTRLALPLAYQEVVADGGPWAGRRVWHAPEGEVSLWWAPGPTEPLLLSNALAVLEATHGEENAPTVVSITETEWQGLTAFLVRERWSGLEGGSGESLVVQGPDFWLHVLRIRPLGGARIPRLLQAVRETFALAE